MLVSIIVPIYNKEKFITKLLNSIIRQTYKNLEIILIDDGSTDRSLEICERFASKDTRIQIYSQNNSGVSTARNKGIEVAKGEYILFIDSDDDIANNFVESFINNLEEDCVVKCNYKGNKNVLMDRREYLEKIISGEVLGVCWGYLLEKEKIGQIRFDQQTSYMEDTIFMVEYINQISKVKLINQNVYYHTRNEESLTSDDTNIEKKINEYIYSLNKIKKIILKKKISIKSLEKYVQQRKIKIIESEFARIKNEETLKKIMDNKYVREITKVNRVKLKYKLFIKLLKKGNIKNIFLYIKFRNKIKTIIKG